MKTVISLAIVTLLISCTKPYRMNGSCDPKMIERFRDSIACTPGMHTFLSKGDYKGRLIYYLDHICPTCNTMPPQTGYLCNGDSLHIDDFNNTVKNTVLVSDCQNYNK